MRKNVPSGQWVEVPKGFMPATGTYTDENDILRSSGDHSCVVWHLKNCGRRKIHPDEIVYDLNKAPWCPVCYAKIEEDQRRQILEQLKKKPKLAKELGLDGKAGDND